ncbi:MAG TPA: hypothetical protein VLH35_09040 [Candidatus Acidoferrales bacterium]|nr:hypothetical protein [Candidatus Acidoferrales bacterium]
MYHDAQIILGAVSIALALGLVYLFFKVYRTQRGIYLLGLPFGFLFLSLSYLFLGIHLASPYEQTLSGSLMWLRVITQTGGFLLIALSYLLSNRNQPQKTTQYSFTTLSLMLVVSVICLFCLIAALNPPGLSIIYSINEIFTIVNLGFLSCVIVYLFRKRQHSNGAAGLLSAPLGFTVLWLGQLAFLIWDVGHNEIPLLGSQIARIIGLAIFIGIYYQAIKGAPKSDCRQTK